MGGKEGARGGSDDASTARGMIDETKFSSRKLTGRAMETAGFTNPRHLLLISSANAIRHSLLAASISFLVPDS